MFANRFTALIDACVLVDPLKRNVLLSLAQAEFFRPRWSPEILAETEKAVRRLLEERSASDAAASARSAVQAMERAFEDASVSDYDAIKIDLRGFPDPKDHHVVAAAVKTKASIIVTENLKDFPHAPLEALELEAKSADEFIADSMDLNISRAIVAIRNMRLRFKRPDKTPEALLLDMESRGLTLTVDLLKDDVASL